MPLLQLLVKLERQGLRHIALHDLVYRREKAAGFHVPWDGVCKSVVTFFWAPVSTEILDSLVKICPKILLDFLSS